ncbi:MAG: hypothetical protein WAV74_05420 [Anaerolineae bacterium]
MQRHQVILQPPLATRHGLLPALAGALLRSWSQPNDGHTGRPWNPLGLTLWNQACG